MPAMAVGECAFPLCPRRSPSSLWEQRLHFSRLLSHRATVRVSAAHAPARARARPLSRLRSSRGGRSVRSFFKSVAFDVTYFKTPLQVVFRADGRRFSGAERGQERTKTAGNERARGNDDGQPVDGGNVMSRVRPTAADVVDRTCRAVRAGGDGDRRRRRRRRRRRLYDDYDETANVIFSKRI
ncbi:hypothetical protein AGLY_006000 [Aphis glycines]|uniref:Uncharacterized protein n=1 Tax=Aphis glycines TaxID=307491 RepID=A0A6G0TSH4_APHGL|nr:hypothetical protein AGLY_006000 [Aphis glycines]